MAHDWGQGSECDQCQESECDQGQGLVCDQGQGSEWDQCQGSGCDRAQSVTRVRAQSVTRVRAQCTAVLVRAQCGPETGAWPGPWAGLSASQLRPLFRLWESPSASSSGPKVAWPLALHTFSYRNPLWL